MTGRGVGRSFPLGARPFAGGVNFSVYSRDATALELLLFDGPGDAAPSRSIRLDPRRNRTYHYWHVHVPGLSPKQVYGWRAEGPFEPALGRRFDPEKLLLDPYGRAVAVPPAYSRAAARRPGNTCATAMKSVVADLRAYDWEGDHPPHHPFSKTVIYEMHVGGFTRHPNSGVVPGTRGTFAGLIEKIPYLKDLGVTAVEMLPIFQFDPQDAPPGLANYWGYSPVSFFAPHHAYSSRRDPLGPLDEFRDLVKALHRAGIEAILDVVYNHTAEGDERGPTFCYRGFSNEAYYILGEDRRTYADYSGTGNTLKAHHSVVRRMVLDSLRYWVEAMHVDGFRFDLASILSRDENGAPLQNPPLVWDIESDPVMASVKVIAEAWDAAGLYQVGRFAGDSWKEWNGVFRDDVRAFLKGDRGSTARMPARLLASPDLYEREGREPEQSVNFVACHDGFTLNDLVSYDAKRNEANGEANRDGTDRNLSWNCGAEGPTDDPAVEALRNRQVKNFLALNLLALGTPMIQMGDEARRTQGGNNNAYCQDNETSWFDWGHLERHADVLRFVKLLIHGRLRRGAIVGGEEGATLNELLRSARIEWHGVTLGRPDWSEDSRAFAFSTESGGARLRLHGMLNAHWEPLDFELPSPSGAPWYRWIDTSLPSPEDIVEWVDAPPVKSDRYRVAPRTVAFLFSRV